MSYLRLPKITGGESQQPHQLKNYLTYLGQKLNFLLENAQKEENNGKNQ